MLRSTLGISAYTWTNIVHFQRGPRRARHIGSMEGFAQVKVIWGYNLHSNILNGDTRGHNNFSN